MTSAFCLFVFETFVSRLLALFGTIMTSESSNPTPPGDKWERKLLVFGIFYSFLTSGRPLSSSTGTSTKSFFVYLIPDWIEIWNVGFWGEGKTGVPGEKPLRAKERTNNKLNPHMASMPGFEPGPHWWGVSALTTAQSLAPQTSIQGTPSVLKMWLISKRVDMFKFTLITITKTFTNWTISPKSMYYLCEFNI